MCFASQDLLLSLTKLLLLVVLFTPNYGAFGKIENNVKSAVFLSPKIELEPGSVANKYYYDIDFPRGHVALKSFNAEVVDEGGNPLPLHETYLHHWVVLRYHQQKNVTQKCIVLLRNSGICQSDKLGQYFGLGSETRGTDTYIPDPFGIEIGNPKEISDGYEEKWMVNVHAIDTRGAKDKKGCTECLCDLYNVTKNEYGEPLMPGYKGGLYCCYDYTQCKLREGFKGIKRSIYLRYTIKWVEWKNNFIVPVKIYILDVTDTFGLNLNHDCKVEYDVESCSTNHMNGNGCIHVKRTRIPMKSGGYVIYGVSHQHSGGIGSTLYGEDGRVICSSIPSYGNGTEAGNESDYIVGMSTCYPKLGSVKIFDAETLTLESNYSSNLGHTGVMGLFYLLVAEKLPQNQFRDSISSSFFHDMKNIFY
ncbi:hypothetical protein TanjilG_09162 [Lupinus angustifolius]|uniref:Stress up-regulated Nod 19 protein n=1 Tax=Lupinus angustifolius TaxID=3871 RepID=A0A1J7I1A1_LUPAN|nr:PREDICTED: uncharacterized protein LOC109350916 [Lupinus angustifolius]OIW18968.1 hypothetical protein TanjilG_09162 [Lupinus angustifolius]